MHRCHRHERGAGCGEPLTLFSGVQQGLDAGTDVFGGRLFVMPKIVNHSSNRQRLAGRALILVDMLQRIDTRPAKDIDQLIPQHWKDSFGDGPLRRAALPYCRAVGGALGT